MGYELRTNTIEPRRHTFDAVSQRFGDKAGSRYQEATYGAEPEEHFGFRPFWAPEREIYDPDFSVVKLADPYTYTDPRQYYYATYVANRAADMEAFGRTLKYAEDRNLLDGMPPAWLELVKTTYLPLRHYESGAEMVTINACRFALGNSISQALSFAAFDRDRQRTDALDDRAGRRSRLGRGATRGQGFVAAIRPPAAAAQVCRVGDGRKGVGERDSRARPD